MVSHRWMNSLSWQTYGRLSCSCWLLNPSAADDPKRWPPGRRDAVGRTWAVGDAAHAAYEEVDGGTVFAAEAPGQGAVAAVPNVAGGQGEKPPMVTSRPNAMCAGGEVDAEASQGA